MQQAIIASFLTLTCLQFASMKPEETSGNQKPKPTAVVELFTSEGCSSCPPADLLLTDLIHQHAEAGDLIALSFHVDYWNNLGWKDPWSSAAATGRQQAYHDALADRSLYTPQMVVGGSVGFVGSDRARAESEIASELLRAKPVVVEATPSWKVGGNGERLLHVSARLALRGESGRDVRKWTVLAAVVEKDLSSDVRRGENAGKKLLHENVVRSFKLVEATVDAETEFDVTVPAGVQLQNADLVVLVQAAPGKPVAGAAKASLPPLPGSPK